MNFDTRRIVILVFAFLLVWVVVGCATSDSKTSEIDVVDTAKVPLEIHNTPQQPFSSKQIGNQVGDIAPEFSVSLSSGETLSYSRVEPIPTFLFFFIPT